MLTDPLAQREQLIRLDHAIGRLRAADQALILMRYFQSMELVAIGQSLAISESTARKRLTRAVQRLRRNFVDRNADFDGLLAGASVVAAPDVVRAAALNVHRLASATPVATALATVGTISPLATLAGALAAAAMLIAGTIFLRTLSSTKTAAHPAIVAPVVQSKPKPTREQWAELKRTYASPTARMFG